MLSFLVQGELPLLWPDVRITGIETRGLGSSGAPNELRTFWGHHEFELKFGLGWQNLTADSVPVRVCAKHLDHEEFNYVIDYVRSGLAQ